MGGRKKNSKKTQPPEKQAAVSKQPDEEKRYVNLLHVYTIYKQKLRRLTMDEFIQLLRHNNSKGKCSAIELCKELMKAKQIPDEVSFEKNVGFLSFPRFMPMIALLAERAGYKIKPSMVRCLNFAHTPQRFQEKFSQLMVYGFWFLGRVISDSLSVKDKVNRGNVFNFSKGDMGFWWAGVKILDWNCYVHVEKNPLSCHSFLVSDPAKNRFYTSRAIFNMHKHPAYFLTELDWENFFATVKSIRHYGVVHEVGSEDISILDSDGDEDSYLDGGSSCMWTSGSDISSIISSEASLNTLASRESVD